MSKVGVANRIALAFAISALTGPLSRAQQAGQTLYQSNCAGCHGLDARGGEHAPNIASVQRVQQMSDAGLLRVIRNGIPASGMPAFGSRLNSEQLVLVARYLRSLQGQRKTVSFPGNPETGHNLFFQKAGCSQCHMIAGKGGFIAGDLSSYAATHSMDEVREAILKPDSNSDPHHPPATLVTRKGQQYTGVIRNEDGFSIQLQSRDGEFHLFEKSTLASIAREKKSLMPANYGSKLSPADVNDLISYLMEIAAKQPKQTEDTSEQ